MTKNDLKRCSRCGTLSVEIAKSVRRGGPQECEYCLVTPYGGEPTCDVLSRMFAVLERRIATRLEDILSRMFAVLERRIATRLEASLRLRAGRASASMRVTDADAEKSVRFVGHDEAIMKGLDGAGYYFCEEPWARPYRTPEECEHALVQYEQAQAYDEAAAQDVGEHHE